jgi:lipopolysaccharide transport system permease protein
VIGVAWAVLRPFLMMIIFSVVFGRLVRVPTGEVPYPIFAYAGLLPWTFFAAALAQSGVCLVGNASLISKVYFPRLVMPVASVLASMLDFLVAFVLLLAMMLFYGIVPGAAAVAVAFFGALAFLAALGTGLWLSALNVKYRDINHVIPFLIQSWMFLTPVVYPSSLIPERWRLLYALNPMVGVVEGFRWALLDSPSVSPAMLAVSVVVTLLLFIGGLFYFRRMEREFADVV